VKNQPVKTIFGTHHPEEFSRQKVVRLQTLPMDLNCAWLHCIMKGESYFSNSNFDETANINTYLLT